ncbi:tetratricopeptide repeat protein [Calditerrivibrio sp.]|uniref:tetratricopeptide repeat protein n=1 Tax=Calditerrivibrio sp. TaxID=2792612 RepID=UPI003D11B8F2
MRRFFYLIIILFLLVACGKKDKPKPIDNITAKKPIAPIEETKNEKIDAGNQFLLNGDFEKAIEFYNKGLEENRAVAFYNLGVVNYLLGKYKDSEEYFRKAINENKEFKSAYINLAATLVKEDRIREAVETISKIEPSNAKEYLIVAEIYAKVGDVAKAYYYFRKLEGSKDITAAGMISYGLFLKGIGEEAKGVELIDKGIKKLDEIENKDYDDFYQLGLAHYALGHYEKSIYNLKSALNIKKTYEASEMLMKIYESQGKYDLAAILAEDLVGLNPSLKSYLSYVENLIKSSNYDEASNIVTELLSKFDKSFEIYKIAHKFYILKGDLINAHKVAKLAYDKLRDDRSLFFYIRHSILYDYNLSEARKLLSQLKSPEYIAIAKGFLNLKEGSFSQAEKIVNDIKDDKDPDYNYIKAFLLLRNREYSAVEKHIDNMEDIPERFFYKFIYYYNTKQFGKLAELSLKNVKYIKNVKRYPRFDIKLQPTLEDLNFAFEFRPDFETMLRLILTPMFIDPEEMTSYLSAGYNLLQQSDQLAALRELKKSVNFSEGIRHNNTAVKYMLEFDYESASKELTEAANYLGDNPIVYFNIGLLMLNLGNIDKAYEFFDSVLLNNKFVFPAYLGKAVCLSYQDERVRVLAQYDMLISNYNILENNEKTQARKYQYYKLLAMVGYKKYDELIETIKDNDPLIYKSIKNLAILFKTGDYKNYLKEENHFFRNKTINALLTLYYDDTLIDYPTNDRVSDYMMHYLSLSKDKNHKLAVHNVDKYLLIENIRYDIFYGKNTILENLRRLKNLDSNEVNLYKLSLYYFTLKKDVINAELSLKNLKKYNMDKQGYYYQMLYHLLTNNTFNLSKSINKYIEIAPNDYRGYIVELLKGFRENNLQMAYDNGIRLEKSVLKNKKMPLEIVLNEF